MSDFALKKILGLVAAGVLLSTAEAASALSSLLENSPFGAAAPDKPTPASQTQLELRGVVVEGVTAYFTFYDATSKKWTTVQQGEEVESLLVKEYNRAKDSVVLDFQGKTLTLAIKSAGNQSYRKVEVASMASVAQSSVATVDQSGDAAAQITIPQPALVPLPAPAEAKRLELVASAIRQQIEQAKRKAGASRS